MISCLSASTGVAQDQNRLVIRLCVVLIGIDAQLHELPKTDDDPRKAS